MDLDLPSSDDLKALRAEVARFPTDLQRRFRLGVALSTCHDYDSAIPELQRALGGPHFRFRAMRLLLQGFEAQGMADRAARLRDQLSRESGDEGDAGSAPAPAPTRPVTPPD